MAGFENREVPMNREEYGAPRIIDTSSTVYGSEAIISVTRPTEDVVSLAITETQASIYLGNKGTPSKKGKK